MDSAGKSEKGMMTVEAVLSLVPFIMVILGIISFINIFMVHNRIQYAMYQIGNELSAYTYLYQATGLRNADKTIEEAAAGPRETVQQVVDFVGQIEETRGSVENWEQSGPEDIVGNTDEVIENGRELVDQAKALAPAAKKYLNNPTGILWDAFSLGLDAAAEGVKSVALGGIANGMMGTYLDMSYSEANPMNADEYLKFFGVKSMNFNESSLFADADCKIIDIVVEYDIEVYILKLFLKDPTIHVVQRVVVPAWLDGDGRTYQK